VGVYLAAAGVGSTGIFIGFAPTEAETLAEAQADRIIERRIKTKLAKMRVFPK
jgi:hypothetical protein